MSSFVQVNTAGTLAAIPNNDAGVELQVAVLTDPLVIQAYKTQVADQMNAQANRVITDLSERIADIRLQTTAQGASILELDIIDPYNLILRSGFVTTDDGGYLYPPIDVNFPDGQSDAVWRLCAIRPSAFKGSGANVVWTFEDRIVSILRDMSGPEISNPGETLGGFIARLVQQANLRATGRPVQVLQIPVTTDSSGRSVISSKTTANNATLAPVSVTDFAPIRLVELVSPDDPNYQAPLTKPASFNLPGGRNNPNKDPGALTAAQQAQLEDYQQVTSQLFGISPGGMMGPAGGPLTLSDIEQNASQLFVRLSYQISPNLIYGPNNPLVPGG